jgi:hypothetical protein
MNVQANFKGVSVFKEKYGHFIGGEWVSGATGETIAQYNPATGETLAHIFTSFDPVGYAIFATYCSLSAFVAD